MVMFVLDFLISIIFITSSNLLNKILQLENTLLSK